MKIVIAGLISFIFCSCQTNPFKNASEFKISLNKLAIDPRFETGANDFRILTENKNFDLKIKKFSFANQNELQSYLLNRRMLLHRTFQDDVAPYFGVIQTEKNCYSLVDTKAEILKKDFTTEYFVMELPINSNKVISDCHFNNLWGIVQYQFYNCIKNNELYEVRSARAYEAAKPNFNINCD